MRVICAPDSFKESATAVEVAAAMIRGIERIGAGIVCDACPIGDGGEGTLDALMYARGGVEHMESVTGPLGDSVKARFGVLDSIGIVELAQASGLALVPRERRDPTLTTTIGTGKLMRAAMSRGCRELIVCIGGSATVDGGTGIVQALGGRFFDHKGRLIEAAMCGRLLKAVARVDVPAGLPRIRVACDVTNPLCGPDGAAATYGPQKGATQAQVRELEGGLRQLENVVGLSGDFEGSGAAGGTGYGLAAMCGARLERGIEVVLDMVRFDQRCRGAAVVLTGEGRLDAQSLQGKAALGVAARAAKLGVPTIAIVGSTGPGAERSCDPRHGGTLTSFIDLTATFGRERALNDPAGCVAEAAFNVVRERMALGRNV